MRVKGRQHIAYLGRTPVMCFLLCLLCPAHFPWASAPSSRGGLSKLSIFTGTQHRHIPAQARLLKALQEQASSAALHGLILISSSRCFHPLLGWVICAWGNLGRASSGYLTVAGGCKGPQGSPEAAEIVYKKLSEGKATGAPLVPINSHSVHFQ